MNSNTIAIIIVTIVVAGGAYWYFFTDTGNDPSLTVSVESSQAQMQFQDLVSKLKSVSFSTKIFDNINFMALVDLTTPITPEVVGRLDPLAPLAGSSATNASTTSVSRK